MFDSATDGVAEATELLHALAVENRDGWSGPARVARAVELGRLAHAATAAWLSAVADADRDAAWEATGATSAIAWVADANRCTRSDATRAVQSARVLHAQPDVAHALACDTITPSHVALLARARHHRAGHFAQHAPTLLQIASDLDPQAFQRAVAHWRAIADDTVPHTERDERNHLDYGVTFEGSVRGEFCFEPVFGAAFIAGIEALAGPRSANDPRRAAERRADAFIERFTGTRTPQINVDVVVDVDTLIGVDRPLRAVRRDLQHVGAVEQAVMARLACDARLGRVLIRGEHEILEVGRRARTISPAQRRAVIARDQTCVWPGCHRGPHLCEVHHAIPFAQGGATDIDNLALLCGRHHQLVHRGWALTPQKDGSWSALPP